MDHAIQITNGNASLSLMLAHLVLLFTRLSSALGLLLEINMHALVLQLLRALVDSNTLPLTCWHDLGESVKLGNVVNAVPSKLSGFYMHLERLLTAKNIGSCRNPNLSDMGSHLVGIDAKYGIFTQWSWCMHIDLIKMPSAL